jgi:hypothetical protein
VGNLQEAGHQAATQLAAVEADYSGKLSDALGEIQALRRAQEDVEARVAGVQSEYGRKLVAAEKQVRSSSSSSLRLQVDLQRLTHTTHTTPTCLPRQLPLWGRRSPPSAPAVRR